MISKYKLFWLILLPALLLLGSAIAVIQQEVRDFAASQSERMMKDQWAVLAALGVERLSHAKLAEITQNTGLRITLVSPDGKVITDSSAEELPTHAAGYAKMLDSGSVLRLTYPAQYYDFQKTTIIKQALEGIILLILLVGFFAAWIFRKTDAVFKSLGAALKAAQKGRTDIPSFRNPHLDAALASLSMASREIKGKNLENTRLNEQLSYILHHIGEGVILMKDGAVLYHNRRAKELLGSEIPSHVKEIRSKEMLALFERFTDENVDEITPNGQIIRVDQTSSGGEHLIILHNISDSKKYSSYKTDLVGNISHELKTPLSLIMGSAETLMNNPEIPEDITRKLLQTIYKNSGRMNAIIEDLTFLHQLEHAKHWSGGESNVNELVDEIRDMGIHEGKNVQYDITGAETVKVHHTHMISLLTNLIGNAARYSAGKNIQVKITKTSDLIDIRVADEGPAIPQGERKRIFERFYSLSQSRNHRLSGSGLGLSIVKHIAKLYKGRVALEINEKNGNTFIVQLMEKSDLKEEK